jgi:hypothetical protein
MGRTAGPSDPDWHPPDLFRKRMLNGAFTAPGVSEASANGYAEARLNGNNTAY